MTRAYTQKDSSVFVQFGPGQQTHYLGDCINIDSIPNPRGDMSLSTQWNRQRTGHVVTASKRGAPGVIAFTIQDLLKGPRQLLEDAKCRFNAYALFNCGTAGIFGDWERGAVVANCELTDDTLGNVRNRNTAEDTTVDYAVAGWPPRMNTRLLSAGRLATAEAEDLLSIATRGDLRCPGVCGQGRGAYERLAAGAAGAIAATANVQLSDDEGNTWAAAAASPFAVNENIVSLVSVELGSGVWRTIAARATDVANPAEIAFSDDGGVTWTLVEVGATNGECATGPKALAAIDAEHIWFATSAGNVYFSSDAGVSWTVQSSAAAASGGAALNAISAVDEVVLWAVGDTDVVIASINGGVTWAAAAATGTGDDLLAVAGFDTDRALIGTDGTAGTGSLWMTFDGGDTWERRGQAAGIVDDVADLSFINEYAGIALVNKAGPVGHVYTCIDGGYHWREWEIPANAGLNAGIMVDVNAAFVVGAVETGTAYIARISG